jgi:hypothetical protein
MAALIPTASATGSGTMTLAGPSTNSNQTITIPDATGTMMLNGPTFSVYRNTTEQSVTSNVATKIQFNAEEFDTANCFDSTTNYRFTPNVAGYYLFQGALTSNGTTITICSISIYKNGSEYKRLQYAPTNVQSGGSAIVYMNGSTDYIEYYGIVTAASGSTFYNGQPYTYATGCLIRGA